MSKKITITSYWLFGLIAILTVILALKINYERKQDSITLNKRIDEIILNGKFRRTEKLYNCWLVTTNSEKDVIEQMVSDDWDSIDENQFKDNKVINFVRMCKNRQRNEKQN